MSFSLSNNQIAGLAGLADIFIGGVLLGSFIPVGLDMPERLPFGGAQQTVVHKLLGGARTIDLMGPDERDITISGILTGPFAQINARIIDTMRQSGQAVPLIWPGDARTVIVKDFRCSYERAGQVLPYSITCLVVPDVLSDSKPDLLGQLTTDANNGMASGRAAQVLPGLGGIPQEVHGPITL